jgi:hypothetical protein
MPPCGPFLCRRIVLASVSEILHRAIIEPARLRLAGRHSQIASQVAGKEKSTKKEGAVH